MCHTAFSVKKIDYYLVNHCSSEGATVGIQPYLSSRLKFQFKKFQNPKQFQFNFKSKYISISFEYPKITFQNSFNSFQKSKQNVTKYRVKLCMGSHHHENSQS